MKYLFFILTTCMLWIACASDTEKNETTTETSPASTSSRDASKELDSSQSVLLVPTSEDGIMETVTVFDSTTQRVIKVQRPVNELSTAIGPNPIIKMDPVKPVIKKPAPSTPQESRVVRVLTKNYWVVWGLLRINNKAATRINQGAWFKFNEDGSYDYGFMEKKIGSGGWSFDGRKARIYLDSELYGDDREWKVLINSEEDQMVWVGTPEMHTTAIQMKLQNFLFIPKNRKEIGLPE